MCQGQAMRLVFERQWLHVLLLAALLVGVGWATGSAQVQAGALWGVGSATWLWISVWIAVAHQVLVWFCWRTELHLGLLSRWFGSTGFVLYAVLFSILGTLRVVAVFLVAIANRGSLDIAPGLQRVVAVLLLVPAVYLFYSVRRYFGFERAFGIDHFDKSYRDQPFVRGGIFKYTSNGMYVYGFLILWAPALWFGSVAALVAALFNQLYIWVHYHATERPDIRRIYGSGIDR